MSKAIHNSLIGVRVDKHGQILRRINILKTKLGNQSTQIQQRALTAREQIFLKRNLNLRPLAAVQTGRGVEPIVFCRSVARQPAAKARLL